jgi:hypothetical protein
VTPLGIESTTCWLVALCLNQLHHQVTPDCTYSGSKVLIAGEVGVGEKQSEDTTTVNVQIPLYAFSEESQTSHCFMYQHFQSISIWMKRTLLYILILNCSLILLLLFLHHYHFSTITFLPLICTTFVMHHSIPQYCLLCAVSY